MPIRIGLVLIASAFVAGCLFVATPIGLRAALPPSPTPTPFVSTFEPSAELYVLPTPTPLSIRPMPKQEGEAEIAGTRARLGEPVLLTFTNGSTARGVLEAVASDVVQIRTGDVVLSFRLQDLAATTQF